MLFVRARKLVNSLKNVKNFCDMDWDVILEGFANMVLAMTMCSALIVFGYYWGSNSKKK